MIGLKDVVERYAALAGEFGRAVALSEFGYGIKETQKLFSSLDEDYHISRFLHFSRASGEIHTIGGEEVTHIAIDPEVNSLL